MCVLPPGPPAPLCNDRRLHGTALTGFSDRRDGQWNKHPGSPSAGSSGPLGRRHERTPDALPGEDLLPQDVCVPAVLGEFAQYVEIHPAQQERAAPVAVDPVVQPQG
jgi:hypothetical protein